jgi:hypothetical protein
MIKLESVGCYIDEVSGTTYPTNQDGTPDMTSPVNVEECTNEWFLHLSPMDNDEVQTIRIELE